MVSLCSAHQYESNDTHFDLQVTLRSRDLRSTGDLDLMRSPHAYTDAYQREDLDGIVAFALAWLVQKILTNSYLFLKCRYFGFFYPCDVIFDLILEWRW